jgi:MFS family permease
VRRSTDREGHAAGRSVSGLPSARRELRTLLAARGLRAVADGYVAVLLPSYLLALGHDAWAVGVISTVTLLGSAAATLGLGAWGHRWPQTRLLAAAAILMTATGLAFGSASGFWPLLLIAFVGTLNPSAGDVSVFLPLEHARIGALFEGDARTRAFARYTIVGSLAAACGALLAGLPAWAGAHLGIEPVTALRAMFIAYGLVGLTVWCMYSPRRQQPGAGGASTQHASAPLGPSRRVVVRLALLFSIDAFAGGLVVNALLALWLGTRFGLSAGEAGIVFFWAGLLATGSQWLAPKVAERIGLLNTMVFTHIPANLALIGAAYAPTLTIALGLLFVRSALSQMDVPTRSAFVMAVVTPAERPAAASFTAAPRSLAAALSPSLGGALFAAGWLAAPLALTGVLKIGYDLALWRAFRAHSTQRPPAAGLRSTGEAAARSGWRGRRSPSR